MGRPEYAKGLFQYEKDLLRIRRAVTGCAGKGRNTLLLPQTTDNTQPTANTQTPRHPMLTASARAGVTPAAGLGGA